MSVNAINAVDAQQPKQNTTASAITTGLGLGVAGAGAGYFIGNKRPDLDKVFAMKDDEFVPRTKDAEGEVKTAVDEIKEGRKAIADAKPEGYDATVTKYNETVAAQELDKEAQELKNLKTAEENYQNAILDKVNEGKEEGKKVAEYSKIGKKDLAAAEEALKESEAAKAVKTAENAITEAKAKVLSNAEAEDLKKVVSDYTEATKKYAENQAEKIKELAKEEKYTKAFEKIKSLFPKEGGWKMAAIVGGIAAAVGLIGGLVMGAGKKEA